MAPLIYLDTHALVWLYAGQVDRIPPIARSFLETRDLVVSPMALVEVAYLIEIGRFTASVDALVETLGRDLGLAICDLPFDVVAHHARRQTWTRDPFDRLIVGQAAARETLLLTKDQTIRDNYPQALWSKRPQG